MVPPTTAKQNAANISTKECTLFIALTLGCKQNGKAFLYTNRMKQNVPCITNELNKD